MDCDAEKTGFLYQLGTNLQLKLLPNSAKPLLSTTEWADLRQLRKHFTTVKCCISVLFFFQLPFPWNYFKRLKSHGSLKNVNIGSEALVLKG